MASRTKNAELAQTLELDVVLVPKAGCTVEKDDLAGTVDYQAVWHRLREVAAERPRKLLETLAGELAAVLLGEFPLVEVGIEIRKSILPGTRSAGVRIWRGAQREDRHEQPAASFATAP